MVYTQSNGFPLLPETPTLYIVHWEPRRIKSSSMLSQLQRTSLNAAIHRSRRAPRSINILRAHNRAVVKYNIIYIYAYIYIITSLALLWPPGVYTQLVREPIKQYETTTESISDTQGDKTLFDSNMYIYKVKPRALMCVCLLSGSLNQNEILHPIVCVCVCTLVILCKYISFTQFSDSGRVLRLYYDNQRQLSKHTSLQKDQN